MPAKTVVLTRADRARLRFLRELVREQTRAQNTPKPSKQPAKP